MNGTDTTPKPTYEELENQVSMLVEDLQNLTEKHEDSETKLRREIIELEKRPTKEEYDSLVGEVKDLKRKLTEATKNPRLPIYTLSTDTPFDRLTAVLESNFTKEELQEGLGDLYGKFHQPNQLWTTWDTYFKGKTLEQVKIELDKWVSVFPPPLTPELVNKKYKQGLEEVTDNKLLMRFADLVVSSNIHSSYDSFQAWVSFLGSKHKLQANAYFARALNNIKYLKNRQL